MMSHARTDMQMIRELAPDESAYRSLNGQLVQRILALYDLLYALSSEKVKGDHYNRSWHNSSKEPFPHYWGSEYTNTNLRYKLGKNLAYDDDDVFTCRKPERLFLPKQNVSTSYAFAIEDYFFAYPNNYNHYVNYYRDTFQHGGISLEEMIIPIITLQPK